ncbi:signal-transducing adaptor protein 1-like [Poeciliopsis prolifica]|uniref:signal-transducing adaptor protein 1-like n=1 Tax=Poeciliopsis prolifica TaxID=188132 RepID=UPI00241383EA|nr:signal-transducing adaptor protein 1-like [Poeciliopsis prolifica]
MARRNGRKKNQLPDLYYEGYMEKRSFKDKTSRKLWTCLCGKTLFFYNDKRDDDYLEKLDLCEVVSVTDDSSVDPNLDAARFNVEMTQESIKFTAPNAESRELWKGFIESVAKLELPLTLNLLPGQIHMLRETIQKEKERLTNSEPKPSPPAAVKTEMPACYYEVPYLEAELLLEREASKGNLLLRPGKQKGSFAITTRQDLDGPIFRHYRVLPKPEGGFYIAVNKPVHFDSLHDVVTYMLEKTDGSFTPLNIEAHYDKNISFVACDNENGERTQQPLLPPENPNPVTGKARNNEPEQVKNLPAADKQEKASVTDGCSSGETPPVPEPRKIPPRPAPRTSVSTQPAAKPAFPTNAPEKPKILSNPEMEKQILPAALSELKLRLGTKTKLHV